MSQVRLSLEDLYNYLDNKVFALTPLEKDKHVGLESEMIAFRRAFVNKPYFKPTRCTFQEQKNILSKELPARGWTIQYENTKKYETFKSFSKNGMMLTFEGGGQLEFSSSPCSSPSVLAKQTTEVQQELAEVFAPEQIILTQQGVDPWDSKEEVGVQKKSERYELMTAYFKKIPTIKFNRNLLQATSLQICLDFGPDESTQVKRYLVGNLIAPFTAAIFANSPYYLGRRTRYKSYRTRLWREHDTSRNGFPKNIPKILKKMTRQSCIEEYLRFSLDCPLVFYKQNGKNQINRTNLSFKKWLESSKGPSIEDYEQAIGLLFPEVRVKGYLEFRSIDNQAQEMQMMPIVLYSGLLYDDETLDKVLDLLNEHAPNLENLITKAQDGLKDPLIFDFSKKILNLGLEGYSKQTKNKEEEAFLNQLNIFKETYTIKRLTPADTLINYLNKTLKPPHDFNFS